MASSETKMRTKPDIRAITRLVPPDGNLVQGQSELAIDPRLARAALVKSSALVFEPYYPYHRRIIEELGGKAESFALDADALTFDKAELRSRCRELKSRSEFPLKA